MADDVQDRLINFAVLIIKFCAELPHTQAGRHVADCLLRSGTLPAPYYADAHASTGADVVPRLKAVLKELTETAVWLRIAQGSGMLPTNSVQYISSECAELIQVVSTQLEVALHGPA